MVRQLISCGCVVVLTLAAWADNLPRTRPVPPGTIARLGSPRMRSNNDYSNGLEFSPNGRSIVLAAGREELWWFDTVTGKTLFRQTYPVTGIKAGRLSDLNELILFHTKSQTGKSVYTVSRYDPARKIATSEITLPLSSVDDVEFDRLGTAVVVRHENQITLCDTRNGEVRWSKTLEERPDLAPHFVGNDSRLAMSIHGTLRLYDAKTGEKLVTMEDPSGVRDRNSSDRYSSVMLSPDGKLVVASHRQVQVVVWEADTGRVRHRFAKQKQPLGFSADPQFLITAGEDDTGGIWNLTSGENEREFHLPAAKQAKLSPDGKRLVTCLDDALMVYEFTPEGELQSTAASADLPGLPDELRFEPDGSLVGRLSDWNGFVVWKNRTPECELIRAKGPGFAIDISADHERLFRQGESRFFVGSPSGANPATFKLDQAPSGSKHPGGISADGKIVVTAHDEGLLRFDMSTRTSRILRSRFANRGAGTVAAIAAGGQIAATEGYDPVTDARHVEIYSLASNRPVREVSLRGAVDRLILSPDGQRLAIAYITFDRSRNQLKNLLVLDPATGQELLAIHPKTPNENTRLSLSPDGRTVAWLGKNEVQIYELATGQIRAKLAMAEDDVHGLALAGDGRTLALAGPGWPVILWDLAGGNPPAPLVTPQAWQQVWQTLGTASADQAYLLARQMALSPRETVEFLKEQLKPAAPPEQAVLDRWIERLDAPAFGDRQTASKELRNLGELAIPELRRVLNTTESAEVRQRIEGLLKGSAKLTPDSVRAVRAVEVLEWLGTPESQTLLRTLATGAEGARQTQDAQAAIARLDVAKPAP